ncbi:MAG: hypothetical protein RLY86_2994 [Pseudomonadota bacterium]|jgi:CubicO group peptidase (beta-lactamase class C family)
MGWLARLGVVVVGIVGLVGAGLAWQRTGWEPVPADAPVTERLLDDRYAAAAGAARAHLERMRAEWGAPSLSAAISIDGRLVWAAAVGWADLENRIPATPDTRYRIGSTSKAVTATVLARLVQEGRMGLDTPIATWLPDLPNPAWAPLTPRQLASHTAGIVDYDANRDWWGVYVSLREHVAFADTRAALALFDDNDLMFPPGTGFLYSSFDTTLLAAAMEGAAGRSYGDLLADQVTGPLRLTATGPDHQDRPVPDRATFYAADRGGVKPWRAVNHSYKHAGGGLVSTSSDLVRMGAAWFDPAFLDPGLVDRFWTPQPLADGSANPQAYAIGWRVPTVAALLGPDHPVVNANHGGVSKGAYSWLNLYPEFRIAVALNMNRRLDEFRPFFEAEYTITRLFLARRTELAQEAP